MVGIKIASNSINLVKNVTDKSCLLRSLIHSSSYCIILTLWGLCFFNHKEERWCMEKGGGIKTWVTSFQLSGPCSLWHNGSDNNPIRAAMGNKWDHSFVNLCLRHSNRYVRKCQFEYLCYYLYVFICNQSLL